MEDNLDDVKEVNNEVQKVNKKCEKSVIKKKRQWLLKRKFQSFVWKHFSKLPGGERVKCYYCGKSNTTNSTNVGTTDLKNHLNRCKVYIKKMKLENDGKQQTLNRKKGKGKCDSIAKIMYVGFNNILFI